MNCPYSTAVQYCPELPFHRYRDPSSCLSWTESSFLASIMSQNQSEQSSDILSQDVFNQLLEMLDQSAFHSSQPIELNFSDSPADGDGPAGDTIQISMDCISMHEGQESLSVSTLINTAPPPSSSPPPTFRSTSTKGGAWYGGMQRRVGLNMAGCQSPLPAAQPATQPDYYLVRPSLY
ncbi:tumor protein 63 [Salmo trutta]|uniref:tumor protein 63 n=1 Tax=Salmo trutta TaxID=8032 RepID=UPI0011320549|nr:tumor protein 63-like [Salmo trutta]